MDSKGWELRRTYIQDMAGNIYSATLNIARGNDRNILYDINNVRRIDEGSIAGGVVSSARRSGRDSLTSHNASSDRRIAQNDRNVKKKFSISPTEKAQRAQERAETAIVKAEISIHAPRVGSDGIPQPLLHDLLISIHAPRVGSDSSGRRLRAG